MGCHPLILGYADKDVNKAVKKQLDLGSTFSLMNELELDVSKLLVDAIPSAEMVRFGKNGADATTIGVKIARAVTNRTILPFVVIMDGMIGLLLLLISIEAYLNLMKN